VTRDNRFFSQGSRACISMGDNESQDKANHQEDMKTPFILGRPFLSTTNEHIDVEAVEIKFHINGKEEQFTFKPRLEQCSTLGWHEKQEQPSRPPSLRPTDAPEA